jgi:hypothetical protein
MKTPKYEEILEIQPQNTEERSNNQYLKSAINGLKSGIE